MITRRRLLAGGAAAAAMGAFAWQHRAFQVEGAPAHAVPEIARHARSVRVQNVDVNVIDVGQGPPTVFLHGIPDTSDLWVESIAALRDTRRCIAIDLPGFGDSVISGDFDWGANNRAAFVAGVLDALGVSTHVRLVAHNAGGTFAAIFAAAHPERVERALFTTTTIHPEFDWHIVARVNRTPLLGELAMAAYTWPRFRSSVGRFAGPEYTEARMREVFSRVDGAMKRSILGFYRGTDKALYREWQPRFERAVAGKPLRVIWGELNPGADVAMARRSFPTEDVIVYEKVGHWPMLEAPGRWRDDLVGFI